MVDRMTGTSGPLPETLDGQPFKGVSHNWHPSGVGGRSGLLGTKIGKTLTPVGVGAAMTPNVEVLIMTEVATLPGFRAFTSGLVGSVLGLAILLAGIVFKSDSVMLIGAAILASGTWTVALSVLYGRDADAAR